MSQKTIKHNGVPTPISEASPAVAKLTTIKLPVGRAIEAMQVLSRFAVYDLPPDRAITVEWCRLKYAISRTFAVLSTDPGIVAGEKSRQAAIQRNGQKDEKGNVLGVWPHQPKEWAAFVAEYDPIASQEMEIAVPKLPASIQDYCPPGLTASNLAPLLVFIED